MLSGQEKQERPRKEINIESLEYEKKKKNRIVWGSASPKMSPFSKDGWY